LTVFDVSSDRSASSQFHLNPDQIAVRDMARAFARETLAPKATEWDEKKHFPIPEMREGAALGMGGIYLREDIGGTGLSRLDATLIFEALATGCPAIAAYMSIHNMTAWMIDAFGSSAQRTKWLPKLCTMELLASYCLTEPGAGSDAAALRTRYATDVGFDIANRALQLHGGYGYLLEYGIEKIVRDLRVHQILEGTNEIMRLIVARGLVGR
jgi:alkylation response protein AidB-like acyl-CoA dehydrogenase